VGQQSLRQYALMREAHAELIEQLQRVESLLTTWLGPDRDQPANTPGDGSSPPISDRAVAAGVLAPLTALRPAGSRRGQHGPLTPGPPCTATNVASERR
jgi:hypothetical protein